MQNLGGKAGARTLPLPVALPDLSFRSELFTFHLPS